MRKMEVEVSDCVWMCDAHRTWGFTEGFWADFNQDLGVEAEADWSRQVLARMIAGEAVPKEEMPKRFFHSVSADFTDPVPDFFVNEYIFFKAGLVDFLKEFDLGNGYFQSVQLLQNDRQRPIDADVFVFCIGNAKDTVDLDKTGQNTRVREAWPGMLDYPFMPKKGAIIGMANALSGPDIWYDPRFTGGPFFLSDKLAQALAKKNLKKKWPLIRIPVA